MKLSELSQTEHTPVTSTKIKNITIHLQPQSYPRETAILPPTVHVSLAQGQLFVLKDCPMNFGCSAAFLVSSVVATKDVSTHCQIPLGVQYYTTSTLRPTCLPVLELNVNGIIQNGLSYIRIKKNIISFVSDFFCSASIESHQFY